MNQTSIILGAYIPKSFIVSVLHESGYAPNRSSKSSYEPKESVHKP